MRAESSPLCLLVQLLLLGNCPTKRREKMKLEEEKMLLNSGTERPERGLCVCVVDCRFPLLAEGTKACREDLLLLRRLLVELPRSLFRHAQHSLSNLAYFKLCTKAISLRLVPEQLSQRYRRQRESTFSTSRGRTALLARRRPRGRGSVSVTQLPAYQ
ncbi:hypothetical protein NDU88_000064 [Pleurodeles waltl]|uniref:Uncharacterized protein n=1 Tax=Pleurodeles waltl TaxID=8319 RepID=A0AAV7VX91_PLEWA|nr:hypothetical protein NDU88_000064 [Pleurodeles waltl]